ncbi:MAG: VWA domain-containing protein [Eubacteriales bacterium]
MKKRIMSLLLTLTLLMSMFVAAPTTVWAADGEIAGGINNYKATASVSGNSILPATLANGQVWTGKTVTSNGDGTFDIALSAIARQFTQDSEETSYSKADVVFVLDKSGSMVNNSSSKLANMKTATQQAIRDILALSPESQIAVVTFSAEAQTLIELTSTGATGQQDTTIGAITSDGGGTNIQAGFNKAYGILNGRSTARKQEAKPVIILLSDGSPTYSYDSTSFSNTTWSGRSGNGYDTTRTHVKNTVNQANAVKTALGTGAVIYTIGFDVGDNDRAIATLNPTQANIDAVDDLDSTFGVTTQYVGETRIINSTRTAYEIERWYNPPGPGTPTDWYIINSNESTPIISDPNPVWTPTTSATQKQTQTDFIWSGSWSGWVRYSDAACTNPSSSGDYRKRTIAQTGAKNEYRNSDGTGTTLLGIKTGYPINYTNGYFSGAVSGLDAIFEEITETITESLSPIDGSVIITDVIGAGFELVTDLTGNTAVQVSGNTITWTVPTLTVLASDVASTSGATPNTFTFRVRLSSNSGAGTYYTNDINLTKSNFTAKTGNPAHTGLIEQDLTATGMLILEGYAFTVKYYTDSVNAANEFTPVAGTITSGTAMSGTVFNTLVPASDIINNKPADYQDGSIINATGTISSTVENNVINVVYISIPTTEAPTTTEVPTEIPTTTEAPEDPTTTEAPEDPTTTEAPEDPTTTEAPEDPTTTEAPEDPTTTEAPEDPTTTEAPEDPTTTEAPEDPTTTEEPEVPTTTQDPNTYYSLVVRYRESGGGSISGVYDLQSYGHLKDSTYGVSVPSISGYTYSSASGDPLSGTMTKNMEITLYYTKIVPTTEATTEAPTTTETTTEATTEAPTTTETTTPEPTTEVPVTEAPTEATTQPAIEPTEEEEIEEVTEASIPLAEATEDSGATDSNSNDLPITGGMQAVMIAIIGLMTVGTGVVLKRRKKNEK